MQFHVKEDIPSLLSDMAVAAEQAATANPKFGDLKITLNIGSCLRANSCIHHELHCNVLAVDILTYFGQSKIAALLGILLVCIVLCALSSMHCAVCIVLCALCCAHCAVCIVLCALCIVLCALCIVLCKRCCLLQAHSCSMLASQCKCLNITPRSP